MALTRWLRPIPSDPFAELERLQEELGRIFEPTDANDNTGLFDRTSSPPVDVVDGKDDIVILASVPGIERGDIELSLASNVLTIKGEKKARKERGKVFRDESWIGMFQRTLSLPPMADPEKVTAELKDGLLRIVIGKREELKPRQIAVAVK